MRFLVIVLCFLVCSSLFAMSLGIGYDLSSMRYVLSSVWYCKAFQMEISCSGPSTALYLGFGTRNLSIGLEAGFCAFDKGAGNDRAIGFGARSRLTGNPISLGFEISYGLFYRRSWFIEDFKIYEDMDPRLSFLVKLELKLTEE